MPYEAKLRVPMGADGCDVRLSSRCVNIEGTGAYLGACQAVTYFDNVSVVVNKVDDSGKPNSTSRVVASEAWPETVYDLAARRGAMSISDGKLKVVK